MVNGKTEFYLFMALLVGFALHLMFVTVPASRDVKNLEQVIEMKRAVIDAQQDTIFALQEMVDLLKYKDSIILYRYETHVTESQARIDSIVLWTSDDVQNWLCSRYGYCDTTRIDAKNYSGR